MLSFYEVEEIPRVFRRARWCQPGPRLRDGEARSRASCFVEATNRPSGERVRSNCSRRRWRRTQRLLHGGRRRRRRRRQRLLHGGRREKCGGKGLSCEHGRRRTRCKVVRIVTPEAVAQFRASVLSARPGRERSSAQVRAMQQHHALWTSGHGRRLLELLETPRAAALPSTRRFWTASRGTIFMRPRNILEVELLECSAPILLLHHGLEVRDPAV